MSTATVLDFGALFAAYIASNQKVWKHNRALTCGASEVFDCLRKQVFDKRGTEFGVTPDDDYAEDYGAMERGNIIEEHYVVPALSHALPTIGLELLFAGQQSRQETLVLGKNSATPDGLITGIPHGDLLIKSGDIEYRFENFTDGCIGLEIKSIDPRANLHEERGKHHGQSQMGLGLIRELTDWKPTKWIILYVDASFLSKLTPFVVEWNPKVFQAGQARAKQVFGFKAPKDAPPEGRMNKGCDHCKWRKACGAAMLSQYAETAKLSTPEAIAACTPAVENFLKAKAAAEAAEVAFKEAQQALKESMLSEKTNSLKSNLWTVSWSTVRNQERVSLKAIEEAGIDLAPFKRATADYDKLVVIPKKSKA